MTNLVPPVASLRPHLSKAMKSCLTIQASESNIVNFALPSRRAAS